MPPEETVLVLAFKCEHYYSNQGRNEFRFTSKVSQTALLGVNGHLFALHTGLASDNESAFANFH